jgi:hypothetical protein
MKKIFTLLAGVLLACGAQAQTTIDLSGLKSSDFTYDATDFAVGTYEVKINEGDAEKTQVEVINYIKKDNANWSVLALTGKNVEFHYKDKGEKTNFFQLWPNNLNVNGKNARIVIKNATAGEEIVIKAASKGTTPSVFAATENCTGDATNPANAGDKQTDPANFIDFKFVASSNGDVIIQETAGGFNIASITRSGSGEEQPDPVLPPTEAKVWDFTTTTADLFGAGWSEDANTAGRYTYDTEIAAGTFVDLGEIGFSYGAGLAVGGAKINVGNLRVDIGKQIQLNATSGAYRISGLAKDDIVKIRCKTASTSEARKFTVTNGTPSEIEAPLEDVDGTPKAAVVEAVITVDKNGDLTLTQSKGINVMAITINNDLPEDTSTGIETVKTNTTEGTAMYNLAGQKVAEGYKGVVIMNGKKVVK